MPFHESCLSEFAVSRVYCGIPLRMYSLDMYAFWWEDVSGRRRRTICHTHWNNTSSAEATLSRIPVSHYNVFLFHLLCNASSGRRFLIWCSVIKPLQGKPRDGISKYVTRMSHISPCSRSVVATRSSICYLILKIDTLWWYNEQLFWLDDGWCSHGVDFLCPLWRGLLGLCQQWNGEEFD